MNSTQSVGYWLSLIDANQQVFAGRGLDKTLLFLRNARTPGEGWGAYPKLGSDLHHSALAIQALSYSGDNSIMGTIAGAASVIRKEQADDLDRLGVEDVCDLIVIARAEQRPNDDDYIERLVVSLERSYAALTSAAVSVRTLCSVLLAVFEIGRPDREIVKRGIDQLIALQRPDGGWPAVAGQSSTVVATAMSLRVLVKTSKDSVTDVLRRGLYFLQAEIEKKGWSRLGSGGDTFTHAVVLRALAEGHGAEYKLIQDGVDLLISKMNQDGSWGDGPKESGNIESTSLSLLALIAAGENRFVPARLVNSALNDVQRQLNLITEERNKLREDFEERVQDDCGEVVVQRNALTKENQELKGRIQSAQSDLLKATELKDSAELKQQLLERELELTRLQRFESANIPLSFRSLIFQLTPIVAIILGAIAIWRFWEWPPTWISSIGIILMLVTAGISSWFLFQRTKFLSVPSYGPSHRADIVSSDRILPSNLDSLRYLYMDMAASWPSYIREEVGYRLLSTMIDMPPDIGSRYVEELMFRLELPSDERNQLATWVRYALRLNPSERRILFDQLRRSTLR